MDDVEEIKKLKARYFRCLDSKDWDGYRNVFTDDVVVDLSPAGDVVRQGIDAFMEYVRGLTLVQSVHQGHMPEIDLTSPTTARGIWALEDFNRWENGQDTHGYGHYHETYEKVDGQWRIKTMRLSYLRIDVTSATIRPGG